MAPHPAHNEAERAPPPRDPERAHHASTPFGLRAGAPQWHTHSAAAPANRTVSIPESKCMCV